LEEISYHFTGNTEGKTSEGPEVHCRLIVDDFITYLIGKPGDILRYHVSKKRSRHLGRGSIVDQGVVIAR